MWKGPYTNNIGGGASAFHFYRLRVPCPSHVIFKRPAPPLSIASMPSVHFLTPGALARAPVAVAFSPSAPSHASALPSLEHGIRGMNISLQCPWIPSSILLVSVKSLSPPGSEHLRAGRHHKLGVRFSHAGHSIEHGQPLLSLCPPLF